MENIKNKITFVLTSCNRFDLLEKTIRSFLKFNTYPIHQYIIIEDSPHINQLNKVLDKFQNINFTVLNNTPQLGQLPSIDKAYSQVTTKYIFHCEDDWEFYKHGFIEDSIAILDEKKDIINVWLRELNDTNNHPVENEVFSTLNSNKVSFKLLATEYMGIFHGFTFNPGLRRLSDYELLKPFSQFEDEHIISQEYYYKHRFRGAILIKGAVKHIGDHRKIKYSTLKKEWMKSASNVYKKVKASACKILNI